MFAFNFVSRQLGLNIYDVTWKPYQIVIYSYS